jgi:hypothetical protein
MGESSGRKRRPSKTSRMSVTAKTLFLIYCVNGRQNLQGDCVPATLEDTLPRSAKVNK